MSKLCGSCGSVNADENKCCTVCGAELEQNQNGSTNENMQNNNTYDNNSYINNGYNTVNTHKELSGGQKFGWGALGCCVPIVGLILWLVWSKDRPEEARCLRNGFFVCLAAYALYFIAIFGFMFIGISLSA